MVKRELMNARQAAEYLHTTPATLRTWRYRGHGPPWIKMVSEVRYDRALVDRWLEENSTSPRGAA